MWITWILSANLLLIKSFPAISKKVLGNNNEQMEDIDI